MLVNLVMQWAKIGGSWFEAIPGQNVGKTISKNNLDMVVHA
jgi:hypothetical protein